MAAGNVYELEIIQAKHDNFKLHKRIKEANNKHGVQEKSLTKLTEHLQNGINT